VVCNVIRGCVFYLFFRYTDVRRFVMKFTTMAVRWSSYSHRGNTIVSGKVGGPLSSGSPERAILRERVRSSASSTECDASLPPGKQDWRGRRM